MKALCIGESTYDISSLLEDFPVENKKYDIKEKIENGGGNASNSACLLGKWGVESYLSTAVGSDTYSEKIKKEFEMNRVKLDFVENNYDKDTSLALVVINKQNGSRTILNMTSMDRIPKVKKTELEIEPDIILLDGFEYPASTRIMNRFPNVNAIMCANNVTSEVVELSKYCKYVICSKNFAEELTKLSLDYTNPESLLNVYNAVKYRYPRNEIIITLEEKGIIYSNNNEIKVMPGIKTEIKDASGAQDVFCGAFAYGILNNFDFEKTMMYSTIAYGMTFANYGGRNSLPALNTVVDYYNTKYGSTQNVSPNA